MYAPAAGTDIEVPAARSGKRLMGANSPVPIHNPPLPSASIASNKPELGTVFS